MDTLELNKEISRLMKSATAEEIIEAVKTVEKLNKRKETEKAILEADTEEEKKEIVHEYYMWEWNFPNSTAGKPSS